MNSFLYRFIILCNICKPGRQEKAIVSDMQQHTRREKEIPVHRKSNNNIQGKGEFKANNHNKNTTILIDHINQNCP